MAKLLLAYCDDVLQRTGTAEMLGNIKDAIEDPLRLSSERPGWSGRPGIQVVSEAVKVGPVSSDGQFHRLAVDSGKQHLVDQNRTALGIAEQFGQPPISGFRSHGDTCAAIPETEPALHRPEDDDIVEIGARQIIADRRRKIDGDFRFALVAYHQHAAQTMAMGRWRETKSAGSKVRTLATPTSNIQTSVAGQLDKISKAIQMGTESHAWRARNNDGGLGSPFANQPVGLQITQGLADCDQANAETVCKLRLGRQCVTNRKAAGCNVLPQDLPKLAIEWSVAARQPMSWPFTGRKVSGRFRGYLFGPHQRCQWRLRLHLHNDIIFASYRNPPRLVGGEPVL
jgi:hypothetical protein